MGKVAQTLLAKLHLGDPYENFPFTDYPLDLQGGPDHPLFRSLITNVKPTLVLEVGAWKGASAIKMATLLKELGTDAALVCVDTWLGGIDHLMTPLPGWDIKPFTKHGYSTLYYQFLANVMQSACQDWIVPFANTSATAARWLARQNIQADLIFVDASHEEDDVYQDLLAYWKVLRPGGIMFGDDWSAYWHGVICAVSRFVREREQKLQIVGDKWLIQKSVKS